MKNGVNQTVKEWGSALVVGVVLALVIKFFFVDAVFINGHSMLPTFQDGDVILVEKVSYRFNEPKIGDIIIVPTTQDGKIIIKRIVGLPGDTIEVKDGLLYRNDVKIQEKYINEPMDKNMPFAKKVVEEDAIFVMGDNRNHSSDSRVFSTFKKEDIKGRVFLELYNDAFKTY